MANDGNDILMRILLADGTPLYAECQTEVTRDMDDFVDDYFNGEFFEVKSFTIGLNISEKDEKEDVVNQGASSTPGSARPPGPASGAGNFAQSIAAKAAERAARVAKAGPTTEFARWKSSTPEQIAKMPPYPLRWDEVTITRLYDKASPVLFEKCCNSDSFLSASLIKRKLVGADMLRGFLRMDFKDLLVSHVQWENEDMIKETFKFVFREMTVKYRVEALKANGGGIELKTLPPVNWKYDMELKKTAGT